MILDAGRFSLQGKVKVYSPYVHMCIAVLNQELTKIDGRNASMEVVVITEPQRDVLKITLSLGVN